MQLLLPLLFLLAGFLLMAQPPSPTSTAKQDPKRPAQKSSAVSKDAGKTQDTPVPLFTGKLGVKSSTNTKESAVLGFNGIDPSGQVDAKMLSANPTDTDHAKVLAMADRVPAPADLKIFLHEGGLKQR